MREKSENVLEWAYLADDHGILDRNHKNGKKSTRQRSVVSVGGKVKTQYRRSGASKAKHSDWVAFYR